MTEHSILNDPKKLVELVAEAAERASEAILDVYQSDNFHAELKNDQSPLTIADKRSHDIINVILSRANIPILSEEGTDIPFDVRQVWPMFWLVDPLDGTKEFLKKNGEFTVNIALMKDNQPVFGLIAIPVEGKIYYGPVNGEVICVENDGSSRKLELAASLDLEKSGIRVVASRSHLDERTSNLIARLKEPVLVSKGSSLKFMLLAEGDADFYPRFAPTMEWDTAAADAMLRALNFRLTNPETGEELKYNKQDLKNPFFICRPA